jgi:two-component system response regulator FixJ
MPGDLSSRSLNGRSRGGAATPGSRTIHIIDDEEAVRDSATALLEAEEFSVVAYASGADFLTALDQATPGCILLDIHMPELTGLEVQRLLNERKLNWPVIVLTGQGDVATAVQAMKNGAFEFLEKPYRSEALLGTVTEALDKFSAATEETERIASARALIDSLTSRERQVMQGLLAGLPNKLIGFKLGISPRTVDVYRANVMDKLKARGLSTVVRVALDARMEPLE